MPGYEAPSTNFKVIGLIQPGLKNAWSGFKPATFRFSHLPEGQADAQLIQPPWLVDACWLLLEFYIISKSKATSERALTSDSAHSWQLYSAAPLGNEADHTIIEYYPGNELPRPCLFIWMLSVSSKGSFIWTSTDRTAHNTTFDGPIVDHWLEWEITQTTNASAMQDRSTMQVDPNLYSRVFYHLSYVPPPSNKYQFSKSLVWLNWEPNSWSPHPRHVFYRLGHRARVWIKEYCICVWLVIAEKGLLNELRTCLPSWYDVEFEPSGSKCAEWNVMN